MSIFNKNRLQELAGIQYDKISDNNNVIKENLRIFGIVSPGAIGSIEDIEEEEECPYSEEQKEELSEISLNPSTEEIRHIEHIQYELMENMKVMIDKLETIGDYENLDKAVNLFQSMQNNYDIS